MSTDYTSTTNLALKKPDIGKGSGEWGTWMNDNLTTLDSAATLTGSQTLTNKTLTDCVANTQSASDNSTKVATTAYVDTQVVSDAELSAIAGLTSAADKGIQFTGSGSAATYDLTTAGKALLDDANASAQRTTLGLGAAAVKAVGISDGNVLAANDAVADDDFLRINGTEVEGRTASQVLGDIGAQASDADLAALAGLTSAADKGIQFTGSGSAGTYDLTTAGKALLDDANASAQRTTLGLGTAAVKAVGISDGNVLVADDTVSDDDFLRINGTEVEGRTAGNVLTDIGAAASSHSHAASDITSLTSTAAELNYLDNTVSITRDGSDNITLVNL